MESFSRLLFLLMLISMAHVAISVKWVRVSVPQFKAPGEAAVLHCDYDLGGDALYAVKWYKEHQEFYRFVPKANPQANSYKIEGVHVDMSKSSNKIVALHSVGWKTSGVFRCEVSAEAPSFASAQSEARLEVLSLPQEDPIISGVEDQYQIGDEINLNCTSGMSYPPSILQWYINEQKAVTASSLIEYPHTHFQRGLVSVTLGLRFTLSNRHFLGGSMRVKCIASVSPELWKGDRESVVQSMAVRDMREALLLVKSSASNLPTQSRVVFFVLRLLVICWSCL